MFKNFTCILFLLIPFSFWAQKEIYIPLEWQQGSLDYSFDRSAESSNFIVFWGPLAGEDPTQAPADIAFDPQAILNTAEELYTFYIDTIRFVNDDSGLISQYKIILVMLHTWAGLEGWAFGGNYDGVVGAMWMHPHAASSGPTLAHEFTHTLQNYTWMMNPGLGFIDSSYVGFFWETHAEFMALQKFPSVALEFDMARWLNTCQYHWSSTRHHYQAFLFLQLIKEKDGIEMINRLWNESIIGEHPLETYKRLKGIDQEQLNDLFAGHAMRNVTWDYEIGDLLRERRSTLDPIFLSHPTFIPERIDTVRNWYRIQNHLAPQDYGYNIIRLYPEAWPNCEKRIVYINFHSQYILPDYEEAGLRFGFVAVNEQGLPRYSEVYNDSGEKYFEMAANEAELYLVVSGAPRNHHNYHWEVGFPKIYRFPYEFRLKGAVPEGYQPGFRDPPPVAGSPHPNGGGFVAATANVSSEAFVGPHAQVLDNAIVTDSARIKDYAIIERSAVIGGNATVSGLAVVGENAYVHGDAVISGQAKVHGGCVIYDSAFVGDNALIFVTRVFENAKLTHNTFCWNANLHGDIVLGGDAEYFSECAGGTYMQVEGAYGRNCDGLDDHPANIDLTQNFLPASHAGFYSLTCNGLVENYFNMIYEEICEGDTFFYDSIPLTDNNIYEFIYESVEGIDSIVEVWLMHYPDVYTVVDTFVCSGDSLEIFGEVYTEPGHYFFDYVNLFGCISPGLAKIREVDMDTTVTIVGNTLWTQDPDPIFQWFDCNTGLPIPGAVQSSFTPTHSGSYQCGFTTIEGCEAFSACYDVVVVGTHNPIDELKFEIRPNPASTELYLLFEKINEADLKLEIRDMLGHIVFTKNLEFGETTSRIDISEFAQGVYTIHIRDNQHQVRAVLFSKI